MLEYIHFESGQQVHIFDVNDFRVLNLIVGYAKFINASYGSVFYRGETHLHNSMLPSICRKSSQNKYEGALVFDIKRAVSDEKLIKFDKGYNKYYAYTNKR